ncbi:MAG: nitronate monooxygenase [Desulfarculaceae bacterium]|nr:nitronate monooxygenase [Desulfarculaceae bacterium]
MLKTRATEKLGIRYPIIGGTMMWISSPEFVAAISEAGGLGILASAMFDTKEGFAQAIDTIQAKTDKPFAVNLNLFPTIRPVNNQEFLEIILEKGVKVVETSGHAAPTELSQGFKDGNLTWIHKCVGVRYALKAQSMGADFITVVGYENGGATGVLDIGTLVLVPTVVDAVDTPVIGGGGVSDGRGLAAILALGAEAAIIGTALLLTQECPIHDYLKQHLLKATELDTALVMRTIKNTHRVLNNDAAKQCAALEAEGKGLEELMPVITGERSRKMYQEGDPNLGIVSCGQGVGMIHAIPSVAERLASMAEQAERTIARLHNSVVVAS